MPTSHRGTLGYQTQRALSWLRSQKPRLNASSEGLQYRPQPLIIPLRRRNQLEFFIKREQHHPALPTFRYDAQDDRKTLYSPQINKHISLIALSCKETETIRAHDVIPRALDLPGRNIFSKKSFAIKERVLFHRHRHSW